MFWFNRSKIKNLTTIKNLFIIIFYSQKHSYLYPVNNETNMIYLRETCISARSAARKLPKDKQPSNNDLYKFFESDKHFNALTEDQRKKMAEIIRKDSDKIIAHLLKSK